MKVYIESTIPSYIVARPARDLLQAARQQVTRDWWESKAQDNKLFTSQVVLDEVAFGEKSMAERRLELYEPSRCFNSQRRLFHLVRQLWQQAFCQYVQDVTPPTSHSLVPTKWIYY